MEGVSIVPLTYTDFLLLFSHRRYGIQTRLSSTDRRFACPHVLFCVFAAPGPAIAPQGENYSGGP